MQMASLFINSGGIERGDGWRSRSAFPRTDQPRDQQDQSDCRDGPPDNYEQGTNLFHNHGLLALDGSDPTDFAESSHDEQDG